VPSNNSIPRLSFTKWQQDISSSAKESTTNLIEAQVHHFYRVIDNAQVYQGTDSGATKRTKDSKIVQVHMT
jgi:diketogulonate reductase-like aldo/keto reductase